MIYEEVGSQTQRTLTATARLLGRLRLDGPLLIGLGLIALYGQFVLYSASGENLLTVLRSSARLALGAVAMLVLAQLKPKTLRDMTPWLFALGVVLLIVVDAIGYVGKGAQRWLDLGPVRFQPSELMKLAVPMMCAWYLHDRTLPPDARTILAVLTLTCVPTILTMMQPDLGTGMLILIAGMLVLILAGLGWRIMLGTAVATVFAAWLGWEFLHDYQRRRVLTFLDPSADPLGAGYHIIQSTIAIGSGGLFGKGWTRGSQGQLEFLPERSTDFIYAVIGEEFGLTGAVVLLAMYLFVVGRALYLALQIQNTFGRLLAGSLALTFAVYVFVNMGMVTGLLPVVGVPLPLVSYGGTSA
ncbi:MAG: rod shape-determining protein RodA, partial [Steroidobacteraceae bacterium]|nr:rod shape-determining protein RodA [Steroidobacteraceae bacterium]MDW8259410.1 rod shape-determining protein RodA [Gammaproteobacteria bacterium]